MAASYDPLERLTAELARLPGIGTRSAARLALYIVRSAKGIGSVAAASLGRDLAAALIDAVTTVRLCQECQNLASEEMCGICGDARRDRVTLCVVEDVADLRAIEATGAFAGLYHVLHGTLAPLDGVGPRELGLDRLVGRVRERDIREIIVATGTDVEGDTTALYLRRLLEPFGARLTRLASGVPLGGELEFIDHATLGRALEERRPL